MSSSSSIFTAQRRLKVVLVTLACLLLGYVVWVGRPPAFVWVEGKVKLQELVLNMTWKAALLDLCLVLGLLGTLRWWTADDTVTRPEAATPWSRSATVVLILGLCLAAAIRLPRLKLSLYNDEAHNFARLFCGTWRAQEDGNPALRKAKLYERMWWNGSGNNSQPYSLLAGWSYATWVEQKGLPYGEVVETPVRLPALLAGTVALGLLGVLAWRWGGMRLLVGVLLAGAVHGWHVRYSTEARGYGVMLAGISLLALGLDAALRTGRWRGWLAFAAGVFLCAWGFVGSVYFLVAVFAVLLPYQWWRWRRGEVAGVQMWRPLVAGVLAVMVGAPLLLPMLPQLGRVLENFPSIQGDMGALWWEQVLGYLCWGCPWVDAEPKNPEMLSVLRLCSQSWPAVMALVLTVFMTVYGAWLLWCQRGAAWLLLAVSLLAVVLAWGLMSLRGQYLHLWYVLYALPVVLLCWGKTLAKYPWASMALIMPCWISMQYMQLGRQNERGSVLKALGGTWPAVVEPQHVLMATFWTNNPIYHPHIKVLNQSSDLEPMVQQARQRQVPLFVSFGHRGSALGSHAEAVKRLEAGQDFQLVQTFWGQDEEQFTQYLYQLKDVTSKADAVSVESR